eukprot:Nitzschia sp. Nitz4//scaffold29_size155292//149140//149943//NITZ4_002691-RA/size155292-processed-gene-0.62-mRNA-1//-1//CDS//3329546547//3806//frame0
MPGYGLQLNSLSNSHSLPRTSQGFQLQNNFVRQQQQYLGATQSNTNSNASDDLFNMAKMLPPTSDQFSSSKNANQNQFDGMGGMITTNFGNSKPAARQNSLARKMVDLFDDDELDSVLGLSSSPPKISPSHTVRGHGSLPKMAPMNNFTIPKLPVISSQSQQKRSPAMVSPNNSERSMSSTSSNSTRSQPKTPATVPMNSFVGPELRLPDQNVEDILKGDSLGDDDENQDNWLLFDLVEDSGDSQGGRPPSIDDLEDAGRPTKKVRL